MEVKASHISGSGGPLLSWQLTKGEIVYGTESLVSNFLAIRFPSRSDLCTWFTREQSQATWPCNCLERNREEINVCGDRHRAVGVVAFAVVPKPARNILLNIPVNSRPSLLLHPFSCVTVLVLSVRPRTAWYEKLMLR
jgi:hypothetical protein